MEPKRVNGFSLAYSTKMKVILDFDENPSSTKSQIAKMNGISETSVGRIIKSREVLLAMTEEEHDARKLKKPSTPEDNVKVFEPNGEEKENISTKSEEKPGNKSAKRPRKPSTTGKSGNKKQRKDKVKKEKVIPQVMIPSQEITNLEMIPESFLLPEEEPSFVLVPGTETTHTTNFDSPSAEEEEAVLETALTNLQHYVNTILDSEKKYQGHSTERGVFAVLYELYEDLMESERDSWRVTGGMVC